MPCLWMFSNLPPPLLTLLLFRMCLRVLALWHAVCCECPCSAGPWKKPCCTCPCDAFPSDLVLSNISLRCWPLGCAGGFGKCLKLGSMFQNILVCRRCGVGTWEVVFWRLSWRNKKKDMSWADAKHGGLRKSGTTTYGDTTPAEPKARRIQSKHNHWEELNPIDSNPGETRPGETRPGETRREKTRTKAEERVYDGIWRDCTIRDQTKRIQPKRNERQELSPTDARGAHQARPDVARRGETRRDKSS